MYLIVNALGERDSMCAHSYREIVCLLIVV